MNETVAWTIVTAITCDVGSLTPSSRCYHGRIAKLFDDYKMEKEAISIDRVLPSTGISLTTNKESGSIFDFHIF